MLIFYAFKYDIENLMGYVCLLLVWMNFLDYFYVCHFFIKHSRCAWVTNGAWSDFRYWRHNFVTKIFIFTHYFMQSIFAFCLKGWRQFRKWKSPLCLDVIPFNNADRFFNSRKCYPSPFGINKIIICFSRF